MTGVYAKTNSGFTLRSIAVASAFVLLTYGHWVLSDTRVFGLYAALCMFAVAIVFYQTKKAAAQYDAADIAVQLDRSSAYKRIKQLSSELVALEKEYKTDVLRLEGKWL